MSRVTFEPYETWRDSDRSENMAMAIAFVHRYRVRYGVSLSTALLRLQIDAPEWGKSIDHFELRRDLQKLLAPQGTDVAHEDAADDADLVDYDFDDDASDDDDDA